MDAPFRLRLTSRHVRDELAAYVDGRLPAPEARRVAEHLLACRDCNEEYDSIRLGAAFARQLPLATAPESIWTDIERTLDQRSATQGSNVRVLPFVRRSRTRQLAAAAVLLVAVGGAGATYARYAPPQAWDVQQVSGVPTVGTNRVTGGGSLRVGQWLETDSLSRARLDVGGIGSAEVGPGSRLRLVRSRLFDRRLSLQSGSIQAVVNAPPRLFVVETPVATAFDLGCAYTLEVDENGESRLHVTVGWVELRERGRSSIVPAGMVSEMRRGFGPGTPYADEGPASLRRAMNTIDFGPADATVRRAALDTALVELNRFRHVVTLWHLLARVDSADRERVYDRLASISPPPATVTRAGALRLDARMLERWRESLDPMWSEETMTWYEIASRRVWDWAVK